MLLAGGGNHTDTQNGKSQIENLFHLSFTLLCVVRNLFIVDNNYYSSYSVNVLVRNSAAKIDKFHIKEEKNLIQNELQP